MSKQFPVGLFDLGPSVGDCLFSWICPCFALAYARTNMDNSSCCFNCMCSNDFIQRAMMKQAYGIEYNCMNDFLAAWCCRCCSVNQQFQSSKMMDPAPFPNAGPASNVKANPANSEPCSFGACLWITFCLPCAYGSALNEAFDLNWWLGCCCSNPSIAQNLLRYHDNVEGEEYYEECCYPVFLSWLMQCWPFWICSCPLFVAWAMRGPAMAQHATKGPYLSGTHIVAGQQPGVEVAPMMQQPAAPVMGVVVPETNNDGYSPVAKGNSYL